MAHRTSRMSNSRPIVRRLGTSISSNTRGRVYRCTKCDVNPYQRERSKVLLHFYRKHVAIDQVPFFCTICKFITTSQLDLEKHVNQKSYPAHRAVVNSMLLNNEHVNEEDSLCQNLKHYIPTENDIIRLDKDESDEIFNKRKRNQDVIQEAMLEADIMPLSEIIPNMLGGESLPPPSIDISINDIPNNYVPHKSVPAGKVDTNLKDTCSNKSASSAASTSSSSSSSSSSMSRKSCHNCKALSQDVNTMKNKLCEMANKLDETLNELKQLKSQVNTLNHSNERENRENRHYQRNHYHQRNYPQNRHYRY
ncbi:hypothetical protein ACF0H5_015948 [Mactra antiquata]